MHTGFLGTSVVMDTLADNGRADVAYSLLLHHKFPGWLYSVDQGATTIWERWNGYTKKDGFGPVGMNSFNHYAYGSVLAWIYRTVAGIAADETQPGFRNIIMRPEPTTSSADDIPPEPASNAVRQQEAPERIAVFSGGLDAQWFGEDHYWCSPLRQVILFGGSVQGGSILSRLVSMMHNPFG